MTHSDTGSPTLPPVWNDYSLLLGEFDQNQWLFPSSFGRYHGCNCWNDFRHHHSDCHRWYFREEVIFLENFEDPGATNYDARRNNKGRVHRKFGLSKLWCRPPSPNESMIESFFGTILTTNLHCFPPYAYEPLF